MHKHNAFERLILGANASLELQQPDVAQWLAGELQKLYAQFGSSAKVKMTSQTSVEVMPGDGVPKVLKVADRSWELAASNAQTPGQIAGILADL